MELHFPILLDGATGTELQKRGYRGGISAEQWVLEHPDAIADLHNNYIDAGSDVLYAPTFGANRVKLEEYGVFNQVPEYNRRLAKIALDNAEGRALVAGDISQTGKFLKPIGNTTFREMLEIYREQAEALEEAGVDLYTVETMSNLAEARAAVLAIRQVSDKPIMVCFTCEANGRTVMGNDIAAALVVLQNMSIDAFGLNCSTGPDQMLPHIQRLQKYAEVPLIAKPNAGMPKTQNGVTYYDCGPEQLASYVKDLASAGVGIFGSCCGSTEEHIRAIHRELQKVEFLPPHPDFQGKIPLATEKNLYLLPPDLEIGKIYPCDEHLEDSCEEAEEDDEALFMTVEIKSEEELDHLEDFQYAIPLPLCILCNDASLLEQALEIYQGRAIYAGDLPEAELLPLANRYGLVI